MIMTHRLLSTTEAAEGLGIDRSLLDKVASAAPSYIPGGPVIINPGRRRLHRRYPADTLLDWFRAASAAVNATGPGPTLPPTPPAPGRRTVRPAPTGSSGATLRALTR